MQQFLIIQTAFLGDVVLATPLIEKLRRHYPNAAIDFLLRRGNQGLLDNHPHLREVLVWDKEQKYRSLLRLLGRMRNRRYDVVVNLQRFFSSGFMSALSRGREVVGFDKNPLAFAYHRRLPHAYGDERNFIHEVDRNLSLIRHLTDDRPQRPRLYPAPEAYERAPRAKRYICLAPTSVWFTKQWPAEGWIALIERIPQEVEIYLLGGPGDREACENIRRQSSHPAVANMAGELSLLESAAWMEGAVMNYANDSAPVHLASAVNAPMTAIFCSTAPAFGFTPLSDRSRTVETHHRLDCRPCGLHGYRACPEGHFRCADIEAARLWPPEAEVERRG